MEKILVAVDGSETANKALIRAKQIGRAFNSEITIIYVMEDVSSRYAINITDSQTYKDPLNVVFKKHAEEVLVDAMEEFKDYDNKVDTLIEHGNPAFKILDFSEKGNYDLIIMGSRGLGPFSRAVMGSVSNKVVHHAKMSVLIVK